MFIGEQLRVGGRVRVREGIRVRRGVCGGWRGQWVKMGGVYRGSMLHLWSKWSNGSGNGRERGGWGGGSFGLRGKFGARGMFISWRISCDMFSLSPYSYLTLCLSSLTHLLHITFASAWCRHNQFEEDLECCMKIHRYDFEVLSESLSVSSARRTRW